ncbi:MAG: CAP domain-containing protein, partial [Deltaproteobacteria bacterium]
MASRIASRIAFTSLLFVSLVPAPAALAYGEPTGGYPTELERAMLLLVNAARQDPQAWCALCSAPCQDFPDTPRAPLWYDLRLNHSARFHARHLHDAPCFQHDSCCTLEKRDGQVQCAAEPDPACTACSDSSCAGTDPFTRMALFDYPRGTGENIAAGNSGAWTTHCQWLNSPGHRDNLLTPSHAALGTGRYAGGACFNYYWVQNFGAEVTEAQPIVIGGHIDDGSFAINWYGGNLNGEVPGAPVTARVVLDGEAHDLALAWGEATNGTYTWKPDRTLAPRCHPYYFEVQGEDGVDRRYPSSGALVTASGQAQCPLYEPEGGPAGGGGGDG